MRLVRMASGSAWERIAVKEINLDNNNESRNMTTLPLRNSLSRSPLPRGFLLIALAIALACFALSPAPNAFGVSPPPDGDYFNGNTAEGGSALASLTSGFNDTAIGSFAL